MHKEKCLESGKISLGIHDKAHSQSSKLFIVTINRLKQPERPMN